MWSVAVAWCLRTRALMAHIAEVPDLSRVQWDLCPVRAPGLMVILAAKDEAEGIRPAMETLLAQEYPWMSIIAVDDRSEDRTGYVLEELAEQHPGKLDVVHLAETVEGWTGKTFALEAGLQRSQSEYVLFTEADVWISPSLLRRALAYAQICQADHLVIAPTPVLQTWGERAVAGLLQVLALWVSRPWRIADPQARWDVCSSPACSLYRRDALEELGGLGPQRMAVADALTLSRRIRAAGMKQQLVYAPGLVLTHSAPGAWGLIRGLKRRAFALADFRVLLLFAAIFGLLAVFFLPLLGLAWWPTLLPSLLALGCLAVSFRILAEINGIPARFGWLYPLGLFAIVWAMLSSMLLIWWRRGVLWRGTLYPLRELLPYNNPFRWEWEAAKARRERRRVERGLRPSRWVHAAMWARQRRWIGQRRWIRQRRWAQRLRSQGKTPV